MSSNPEFHGTSILLVDDEPNILNALRRTFAPDGYDLHTCADAASALSAARDTDYALVVSDYRMPEVDGISFLTLLRTLRPDAMRLVLSGYTDLDALLGAINDAHIYRFVTKPWNDHELRATVRQALAHRATVLENRQLAERLRAQEAHLHRTERELARLEREHPGITRVRRGNDGSILLDDTDADPSHGV
jgi:DNA-binding NtrC family response regulator